MPDQGVCRDTLPQKSLRQRSPTSGIECLVVWGGADVVIIEIKCTINAMHLNPPKTILRILAHGEIVFHDRSLLPKWLGTTATGQPSLCLFQLLMGCVHLGCPLACSSFIPICLCHHKCSFWVPLGLHLGSSYRDTNHVGLGAHPAPVWPHLN